MVRRNEQHPLCNPVCCRAALTSIEIIEREILVENSARLEKPLLQGCQRIMNASNGHIAV